MRNNRCLLCFKELSGYQTKFCSLSCSSKYNGARRKKKTYPDKICKLCGQTFKVNSSDEAVKEFCTRSCAITFNNKLTTVYKVCPNCNIEYSGVNKYCSKNCLNVFKKNEFIKNWFDGKESGLVGEDGLSTFIRSWLFDKYNSKCAKCGWSEINPTSNKIPLHCHHIDGNYKNNRPENLILLCPNCHSLTPNHGALNIGKGRTGRQARRKKC